MRSSILQLDHHISIVGMEGSALDTLVTEVLVVYSGWARA
jgi:hypothetical protein